MFLRDFKDTFRRKKGETDVVCVKYEKLDVKGLRKHTPLFSHTAYNVYNALDFKYKSQTAQMWPGPLFTHHLVCLIVSANKQSRALKAFYVWQIHRFLLEENGSQMFPVSKWVTCCDSVSVCVCVSLAFNLLLSEWGTQMRSLCVRMLGCVESAHLGHAPLKSEGISDLL